MSFTDKIKNFIAPEETDDEMGLSEEESEKLSEYEQRIKQGEFFVICDYYIAKMNGEIQKWMQQLYQSHFQKEKITV